MNGDCHTMACVQQHANDFYAQIFTGLNHFGQWLNAGQPAPPPPPPALTVNAVTAWLTLHFWILAAALIWGVLAGALLTRAGHGPAVSP